MIHSYEFFVLLSPGGLALESRALPAWEAFFYAVLHQHSKAPEGSDSGEKPLRLSRYEFLLLPGGDDKIEGGGLAAGPVSEIVNQQAVVEDAVDLVSRHIGEEQLAG